MDDNGDRTFPNPSRHRYINLVENREPAFDGLDNPQVLKMVDQWEPEFRTRFPNNFYRKICNRLTRDTESKSSQTYCEEGSLNIATINVQRSCLEELNRGCWT